MQALNFTYLSITVRTEVRAQPHQCVPTLCVWSGDGVHRWYTAIRYDVYAYLYVHSTFLYCVRLRNIQIQT